jgi:mannose-6-phosphate isomerase-like protein (cupin superfamily)
MSITRRTLCSLLPGLVPLATQLPALADRGHAITSGAFSFDKVPMHVANNNAQIRLMLRGKLVTGEAIEIHQTTLPPGGAPTATTHHHPHSEMWVIREGVIELTVKDKNYRLAPGSVGFVNSNEEHGIRNVGTTPAQYFVVAVGPGAEVLE